MKNKIKYISVITLIIILFLTIILLLINLYVFSFWNWKVFSNIDKIENQYVWLVLWASVIARKWPSDILKDRLIVAAYAYKKWKIKKIIVSWDNSKKNYNEPIVMRDFLIKNDVNKDDIYMDFAWFDTYDSIYRAKNIFSVDKLVIFTQNFHIKRALYIADRLWIESVWVNTDLQNYIWENYYLFREFMARIKAFINTDILKSKSKFLWEKIVIK